MFSMHRTVHRTWGGTVLVHIPAVSCVPPIRLITHQFRIATGRLVTAARSGAPAGGASRGRTAKPLQVEPGQRRGEICLALAGTSSPWAELPALVVCARESPPTPLRLTSPFTRFLTRTISCNLPAGTACGCAPPPTTLCASHYPPPHRRADCSVRNQSHFSSGRGAVADE